jgi:hypothetical protein
MFTNGNIVVCKYIIKYAWTKLPDVYQYWGQKNPAGIKLQYFCQYGDRKKKPTKEQS